MAWINGNFHCINCTKGSFTNRWLCLNICSVITLKLPYLQIWVFFLTDRNQSSCNMWIATFWYDDAAKTALLRSTNCGPHGFWTSAALSPWKTRELERHWKIQESSEVFEYVISLSYFLQFYSKIDLIANGKTTRLLISKCNTTLWHVSVENIMASQEKNQLFKWAHQIC